MRRASVALLAAAGAAQLAAPSLAAPGALDRSFGRGGVVVTTIPGLASVGSLLVRPDGRLVIVGSVRRAGVPFAIALRVGSRGAVVGRTVVPLDPLAVVDAHPYAPRATLARDGRIVIVAAGGGRVELVRLRADGKLDTAFGKNGHATFDVGTKTYGADAAALPDGRIVAATQVEIERGVRGAAIVRVTRAGRLDRTFGRDGLAVVELDRSRTFRYTPVRIAVERDGQVVAGGSFGARFALVRFGRDGTLDPTFGGAGVTRLGAPEMLADLRLQPDGKLVAVAGASRAFPLEGGGSTRGCCGIAVSRFLRNGRLDKRFGSSGRAVFGRFDGGGRHALAFQRDGKIVVVGGTPDAWRDPQDFVVSRLTGRGRLDLGFDAGGQSFADVSGRFSTDFAADVEVLADGRIVAVGTTGSFRRPSLVVARYVGGDRGARAATVALALHRSWAAFVFSGGVRPLDLDRRRPVVVVTFARYSVSGQFFEVQRHWRVRLDVGRRFRLVVPERLLAPGRWRAHASVDATATTVRARSRNVFFRARAP